MSAKICRGTAGIVAERGGPDCVRHDAAKHRAQLHFVQRVACPAARRVMADGDRIARAYGTADRSPADRGRAARLRKEHQRDGGERRREERPNDLHFHQLLSLTGEFVIVLPVTVVADRSAE
jgi:hypothetical protein